MIEESNKLAQRTELDLIKEDREKAKVKEEVIKQQMERKYNKLTHKNLKKGTWS